MNRMKWNDGAKCIGRCHVCMWYFETIHRKCRCMYCWYSFITRFVLTQYCSGKTVVSIQTHNLRPRYWAKIVNTLTRKNAPSILHHSFAYMRECTEFMPWGSFICNVNNAGLYLKIIYDIISLNTKWSPNHTMHLLIFLIFHNQLYRKQKVVNGDCVFLTVTRHTTWNKSLQ